VEKEWMIPTMRDESPSPHDRESASVDGASFHDASFDSAPFEATRKPSTSAATLDDYFDRLSAAFSHTRPVDRSEALPDPIEDFGNAVTTGPPAASHEWLGHAGEPQGLQAFEAGEGDGNPILGAVSTLMARAQSHHDTDGASHADHPGAHPAGLNGTYAPPVHHGSGAAHPTASPELVDIVTERVLARLVPELTESLRRLVQQEIARTRD
jgi:hypothetical protein